MVGRRYLLCCTVHKYYIAFTTLYYVNRLYILHLYLSWSLPVSVPVSCISLCPLHTTTVQDSFDNGNGDSRCCLVVISERLLAVESAIFFSASTFFGIYDNDWITLLHIRLPRQLIWHTLVRNKISTSTLLCAIISNVLRCITFVLCHLYYVVFCSGGLCQSWYWQAASQLRLSGYLCARRRHPQRLSGYLCARHRHSFLTSTKQVLNKCLSTRIKTR